MTRRKATFSTHPNNNTQITRQARRLARQQKQLDKEMLIDMGAVQVSAKSRGIRLNDVKELEPLTDTQANFFGSYENNDADAYVLYGSAGTGKTFMALYFGLLDVLDPETNVDRIIIVRSSVQSRDQGHLPGDAVEKMAQFELPYHGICSELVGRKDAYEKLKDMGIIEFSSTSFLRGSTFDNAIVIFDEIQSASFHEISTAISRAGKNTKLILCGDGAQNDLITSKYDVSGFREFIQASKMMPEFRHFKFTSDDIVRSPFVKSWIIACEKLGFQ